MKKVIRFTRIRIIMYIVSALLIAGGIAGIVINDGFNLGIDFKAGLNLRVQIAEEALSLAYTGEGELTADIAGNALTLRMAGVEEESGTYEYPFSEYATLADVRQAVEEIPGITVDLLGSGSVSTERIVGFSHPLDVGEDAVYVNVRPASREEVFAPIEEVRNALSDLENVQIQTVGNAVNQEYMIRVEDPGETQDFSSQMADEIEEALAAAFGEHRILSKQTDYVGPRFSRELGQQVVYLTMFAMLLILVYIWFRFRLAYAVSAITAIVHDVVVILGFIATFQVEVSTATIAAVLTIIGYSLNDTIVIFDRVRENVGLLRDTKFETIINTSISQSLSRTLLTSLTTLLGVAAIFIFGSGSIKDFALTLMVGIVVGTYSSMFVASPILLGWTSTQNRRRKQKDLERYGKKGEQVKQSTEPAAKPAIKQDVREGAKEGPAVNETAESGENPEVPTAPTPKERKPTGKKRQKPKKKKK